MKRNLVLLLTCLFGLSAFAQEDPVLMRINGKDITRSEFEYIYNKNNSLNELEAKRADRTHFSNIISNLIDNAVKYSKEEAELSIYCRQTGETVTISITDRGIGIPLDKQKHIFDKFYRVPTGNLHNIKGYGLGLFYVKSMVEKHGGTITVKSEPDKGSTFTITL